MDVEQIPITDTELAEFELYRRSFEHRTEFILLERSNRGQVPALSVDVYHPSIRYGSPAGCELGWPSLGDKRPILARGMIAALTEAYHLAEELDRQAALLPADDPKIELAAKLGRAAGAAAATWCTNGNESEESQRKKLELLTDLDPAIDQFLQSPTPDADTLIGELYPDGEKPPVGIASQLCNVWQDAANEIYWDECERILRETLAVSQD